MKTVFPGKVSGCVSAPPSKSMAQRAIALATIIKGESAISMGAPCDDIRSAMNAAVALGAMITVQSDRVLVNGMCHPRASQVNCGEAGLSLRMFSAIAALYDSPHILLSEGSLSKRPVDMIIAPLTALGATCTAPHGLPPVSICGPITGGHVEVDGTTSSQFLTGLLIALTKCPGDSTIFAPGLKSKPYVQMTLDLLRHVGANVEARDDLEFFRIAGKCSFLPFDYRVPGDWSGASFPLVAGACAGSVTVSGLNSESSQADRAILNALRAAGAIVSIDNNSVTVEKRALVAFDFDATHCPDLFPPLVALAACANGVSRIAGVHRLATKESNRERALKDEFSKLGIAVDVQGDTMQITGGIINGGKVFSHGDHRIAMAAGVAALSSTGAVEIDGSACITKSYPNFFTDLISIGANVT